MKPLFDTKKSMDKLSEFMQETIDVSKRVAAGTKDNVAALVEKTKKDSLARRLKKYNPVFPEQYNDPRFNLPNMIVIVDDAVRRDIDVCEGAIGWLSNDAGIEILHLYDEAVGMSNICFVPTVMCDAIYYVDSFDRHRFINIDCVFSKAHEERMAELKNIAFALGAKRCVIDITEASSSVQIRNKRASMAETFKAATAKEEAEQSFLNEGKNQRSGHIEIEFQGDETPHKPDLKWFAHDDNINRLIEMRLSGKNSIKSETLEISGSSTATMSQKAAGAIDSAVGKLGGAKASYSMDSQAAKEHHSTLVYHIEF